MWNDDFNTWQASAICEDLITLKIGAIISLYVHEWITYSHKTLRLVVGEMTDILNNAFGIYQLLVLYICYYLHFCQKQAFDIS